MDCNKEDAIKARQVAEGKIVSEDYLGAKKFILKSQRLFPSLSGLTQMLTVVNVHISAREIGDEFSASWHQILQVDASADEETIRKQYRRLLLLLHPDKNKYAGAESAFKLVQSAHEAFEKEKELAKASASAGVNQRFWTVCSECKAPSEHLENFEQQYVQCPKCLRSFLAARVPPSKETSESKSKEENADDLKKAPEQELKEEAKVDGMAKGKDELKTKIEAISSSSSSSFEDFEKKRGRKSNAALKKKAKLSPSTLPEDSGKRRRKSRRRLQKTKVLKEMRGTQAGGSLRSWRKASSSVDIDTNLSSDTSSEECRDSVSHIMKEDGYGHGADVHMGETSNPRMKEAGCTQGAEVRIAESTDYSTKENRPFQGVEIHIGECSHHQEHENAKVDVDAKVQFFEKLKSAIMNEFNGGEFQVVEVKQENLYAPANDAEQGVGSGNRSDNKVFHLKLGVSVMHAVMSARVHAAVSEDCMVGGSEVLEDDQQSVPIQVPDNDVYNFDKGKQDNCFEAGQIWAIYDDDDGLPRFYAQITRIISMHPFHVQMKWLYPAKTVSEDAKAWMKAGYAYTCGEFTPRGKTVTRKSIKVFSHMMAHETGEVPGVIRIYPQKGDVWAVYKAWKPHKGETHKCEPVEVLSDYSKEQGVQVTTLFKVNGYRSIYWRKGFEGLRSIPASELKRFSHQVPAHYLVGNELSNLPEDSVDLDMAAFM